jgi:NADH-quinone oxidoreductase subunit J
MTHGILMGVSGDLDVMASKNVWISAICCGLSFWFLVPGAGRLSRLAGAILGTVGLWRLWLMVGGIDHGRYATVFWLLAVLTIGSAVATVSSRSPVYCAIWFAVSLLGTGGLFLLQGAQFLGIATVAVYAGAIVVTFLFVLMLAQPEGHTFYDRISWGWTPRFIGPLVAASLVAIVASALGKFGPGDESARKVDESARNIVRQQLEDSRLLDRMRIVGTRFSGFATQDARTKNEVRIEIDYDGPDGLEPELERTGSRISEAIARGHPELTMCEVIYRRKEGIHTADHVAVLGARLFGRHLIAVEVAGCLLMAALVGAIAIVSHGSSEPKAMGTST